MTDLQRRDFLKISGIGVAGIAVSSALAACGGSKSDSKSSNAPKKTSTLRVAMPTDVASLDPQKQGDIPSMSVAINIFDMLTTRDANNHLVPGLATAWQAVDAKTWRFTIREGVTFHNGEVCDAEAVAFSINRLLDPKTKSPIVELSHVTSATAVDAKTVDFLMKDSDPILPEKVSLFGGVIVPPKYLAQVGDAGFADKPVGTGPYKFVSRAQDQNITLQANENYWGAKPQIPTVKIVIMPDAAASIAALQAGEVDIVTSLTPDAAKQLGAGSHAQVKITPGVREYYVAMNTLDGGPLAKTDVRKALNYSSAGFMLLGLVAERASGRALDRLVAQRICDPLGMTSTAFGVPDSQRDHAAATEHCAWRGRIVRATVHDENAEVLGGVAGHAGLFATLPDMQTLAEELCAIGAGRHGIVAAGTLAAMIAPATDGLRLCRGLGWQGRDPAHCPAGDLVGPRSYGHTGFTGTSIWLDPDRASYAILLTNRVHPSRADRGFAAVRARFHNIAAARTG